MLARSQFLDNEVESLVPSVPSHFKIGKTEAQESNNKGNNNSQYIEDFIQTYLQMSGGVPHGKMARKTWFHPGFATLKLCDLVSVTKTL